MHITHVNLVKGFRGGERQTIILIEEIAKQGYHQSLVCRKNSPMISMLVGTLNLNVIPVHNQLYGHLATKKSSIIHAHDAKGTHWAWLHKILFKTPYIITRKVILPIKSNYFNYLTYNNADHIVAISSFILNTINKQKTFNLRNTSVIPDAFTNLQTNPNKIKQLKHNYSNKIIIGHIGALVEQDKGQITLLKVAEKMQYTRPNYLFIFLGTGSDENLFKSMSKELANVEWLGFQQDVGNYLSIMDIFIFPSKREGLGSILLDAINFNIPIIANNVGGIPDIIQDNETGILMDTSDITKLCANIELLIENKKLSTKLIRNAKATLNKFNPLVIANKYIELYKSIVKY